MKGLIRHIKKYIIRGLLAAILIGLSFFAIKILYTNIDKRVMRMVDQIIGLNLPGLGILLALFILYIPGLVTSNVIGKLVVSLVEKITNHIPPIKTTYKVGQRGSAALALRVGLTTVPARLMT